MSASVIKVCRRCGLDIARSPRVKDDQGHYFCHPCWEMVSTSVSERESDPTAGSLSTHDFKFIRIGAAVGVVVVIVLLYALFFRNRWESANQERLLTLQQEAEGLVVAGDLSGAKARYEEFFASFEGREPQSNALRSAWAAAKTGADSVQSRLAAAQELIDAEARVKAEALARASEEAARPAPDPISRIRVTARLSGHVNTVRAAAFFRDGRRVATASDDNTVRIWDLSTGQCLRVLKGHTDSVTHVWVDPTGQQLYSCAAKQTIGWDADTGEQNISFELASSDDLCFAADVPYVAFSQNDGTLTRYVDIVDMSRGAGLVSVPVASTTDILSGIALSPDGNYLASVKSVLLAGVRVQLTDLAGRAVRWEQEFKERLNGALYFSHDSQRLNFGSSELVALDTDSAQIVYLGDGPIGLKFVSAQGRLGITSIENRAFELHDLESRMQIGSLPADVTIRGVSHDGQLVATGEGNDLLVWDLKPAGGMTVQRLAAAEETNESIMGPSGAMAMDVKGRVVVTGGGESEVKDGKVVVSDYKVRVWSTKEPGVRTIEGPVAPIRCLAVAPDATLFAAGCDDQTIAVFSVTPGQRQQQIKLDMTPALCTFNGAGTQLATGSEQGQLVLIDVKSGAAKLITAHAGLITAIAFSPDGKQIATGGADRLLKLWNASTGECIATLPGHQSSVNAIAFSADGEKIVTGSGLSETKTSTGYNGMVRRLSSMYGTSLEETADAAADRGLSTTETRYDTTTTDCTVRIWDLKARTILRAMAGHSSPVYTVRFCSNDSAVISLSSDGSVRKWDVKTRQQLDRIDLDQCSGFTETAGGLLLLRRPWKKGPEIILDPNWNQ